MDRSAAFGLGMALFAMAGLATHGVASAQNLDPLPNRVSVSVNAGAQALSFARTDAFEIEMFAETGSVASTQTIGPDLVVDGGFGVRLTRWIGVGLGVSYVRGEDTATIEARIPHPFFFDFHRDASTLFPGLAHRELALHGQLQVWLPLGRDSRVTLAVGPTYFDASQELVRQITTAEVGFPYEEVDIVDADTERVDRTALGYHVSLDVAYFGLRRLGGMSRFRMLDHLGLGLLVRYSRGTASVVVADTRQSPLELGGLHAAGGLRLSF